MTPLLFLATALAGGVGAALRYIVDVAVARFAGKRFPWGILVVNVTGSFALGLVTAALPDALFLIGAGLLGGYTTFSTAMIDTIALWREGERATSVFNALGMLVLSLLAALLGIGIGTLLT